MLCAVLWTFAASTAGAGPWVGASPGAGGAFTAIAAGPSGIILCGSDLGGAYRSLDRGQSWEAIGPSQGLNAVHVSAVAFDPSSASIAYLGSERGVLRSADGGATFQTVSPAVYIAAVTPAPSNPWIVYAPFHPTYNAKQTGLLKSVDRGLTWTTVPTSLPDSLRVTKLIVRPFNPSVLYLISGTDRFQPNAQASLWKSADGGATWIRLAAALGDVWDLAVDPNNPANLYLTTYTGVPGLAWAGALWKSLDAGVTWTLKSTHTGCVRIRPDQPRTVWVIDPYRDSTSPESGCWISTDGADTWSRRSAMTDWESGWQALNWAYGSGAYGLAKVVGQDLSQPDALYWADRQFVFGSFDGGTTFENLFTRGGGAAGWISRGVENVAVTAVAISPADTSRMYAGYYDLGLWRSTNGGASWQPSNPPGYTGVWAGHGGCATSIVPDPVRPAVVFTTLGERADMATVLRSDDGGSPASWTPSNAGLPPGFVYGLSLDWTSSSATRTLFVTANGDVYKSVDDGASWSLVLGGQACRVTAVDRTNGSLVFAGGEGGLWRSTQGGAPGTWTRISHPAFLGGNLEALANVQWTGVQGITACQGRVLVAAFGDGRGVYRSTDQGGSWSQIRAGDFCRAAVVDPLHPDTLFVTSSHAYKSGGVTTGSEGVLRSIDGGLSWLPLNDGLPWPFAGPIAMHPGNPWKVLVGSPGTGFWLRDTRNAPDVPPVVLTPAAASVEEGSTLRLGVTATDPNGDAIATLTALGLPAGATFQAGAGNQGGTLTWTPSFSQAGLYVVTFTAANALIGAAATTITVLHGNQPPTLVMAALPTTGNYPLAVAASAAGSVDPDGTIVSYRFDFGDGATAGPQVSPLANHLYVQPGTWTLTLTATDNEGASRSQSVTIQVGPIQPGPNLCANGSVETDSSGWNGYGAGAVHRVPGGFDGGAALQVQGPSSGLGGFGINDAPDWVHGGAAGQPYRYTAWARSAAGTGACRLQLAEYDGGTKVGGAKSASTTLSPTWQMLSLDYTTARAGTTLDFQVVDVPAAPGETFLVDDVAIHLLSSPVGVADELDASPPLTPSFSPSPLRTRASLRFRTSRRGALSVGLYDPQGRRVRTLLDRADEPAGTHRFVVDGTNDAGRPLASGLYFYRIRASEGRASGRFTIVR